MSAEVVDLALKRPAPNPGNGAREVALAYWRTYAENNGIGCTCGGWVEMMTDNMLGFLWNEGFKIVPLDPGDAEYDGPDWTGEEKPRT